LVHKKVGDQVKIGDPIITIFANQEGKLLEARTQLLKSFELSDETVDPLPLFYGVVQ
jgi:thymidine phosphorylase